MDWKKMNDDNKWDVALFDGATSHFLFAEKQIGCVEKYVHHFHSVIK